MAEERDNVTDEIKDAVSNGGPGGGIRSALMSKEILIPAALSAGAALAARKGPDLIRNLGSSVERKGQEEAEQLGEKGAEGAKKALTGGGGKKGALGKVAGAALGKVGGGKGGGGPQGKTRRLPIQRWTDVAVPVEVAYREWTNFEEFPKFMHRVLSVNKEDEKNIVRWEEKIWFSRRQWEGEITDQRRNDRIAWKTKSGMQHAGVVSFHQIGPRLTRVMVTMDFVPQGMIEKMGSGMRFVKRAVQADLARFKAQVEMKDAKGLEYRSGSDEQKEEKKDEAREEREREQQKAEAKSRGSDDQGQQRGEDEERDSRSNDEREDERRERETRRRERREAVTT
jgi:uncharacterized membrane protein